MRREDDQELWDLLGHASGPPKFSEFFARNVVRQVRQESRPFFEQFQKWLSLRRLIPASVVAIALVATFIAVRPPSPPRQALDGAPDVVAKVDMKDYDVVADLDELIASDENSLWDDNQSL
jgi:hypothetical protein